MNTKDCMFNHQFVVKKLNNKEAENNRYKKALEEISQMGDGIKPNMIDWANIGRNAKYIAKTSLAKKRKK